jgi:hypothetical protein
VPELEGQVWDELFKDGIAKPGSGIAHPLTCDPVTVKWGSGEGGMFGQTPITLPSTDPLADPLSLMLPFDHTSPVMVVVELPANVSEVPPPLQSPGLSVCMAAPFVPFLRAIVVALARTGIRAPLPSTCMIATGIEWLALTVKLIPATPWSEVEIVMCWPVESP